MIVIIAMYYVCTSHITEVACVEINVKPPLQSLNYKLSAPFIASIVNNFTHYRLVQQMNQARIPESKQPGNNVEVDRR